MPGSVIVAGARTPIGKLSGALASMSAADLGGIAIKAAMERAGVRPDQIDYVYMGQVIQAGQGQQNARAAAVNAGIGMEVASATINKVCLSGLNTILLADQLIQSGYADIVVAGGMESMTNAPHFVSGLRSGIKLGDGTLVDSMMHDALTCTFDQCAMGASVENYMSDWAELITREGQDTAAAKSHERAAAAMKEGRFAEEITPVAIPQRKGDPILVEEDEGVRPGTTAESLSSLRAAFAKEGTITAGNASQISDGAAAVIVMSKAKAEELGTQPLAELVSYGMIAGPDPSLLTKPSVATKQALDRAGLQVGDLDLIEFNEAFAAVGLASMHDLGVSDEIVNVNGGAIALGHPVGMSGTRVALHLMLELKRRGGGTGAAALCGGGGQGDAAIFRTL
ncbi:MAG: putative acetyl-CoA acetyltransferase [Actinomycetia bacterium]|nr:putative acetyl-CoA acetyltransferase [Actinomycetes bacterium]